MADAIKRRGTPGRRLIGERLDAQITSARVRESGARAAGLRAKSARYDDRTERVVLELTNGIALAFPVRLVRGLKHATRAQRGALTLSPSGSGVIWEELDAD